MSSARPNRWVTIRALEACGQDASWDFAQADAFEAAREAEAFFRNRLDPYLEKTDWSEQDFADLMRLEFQYQDMSRHSRQLMDALLLRPAPTAEALQWKLDYLDKGRLGYHKPIPARALPTILEDTRRLMGAVAEMIVRGQQAIKSGASMDDVSAMAEVPRSANRIDPGRGGPPLTGPTARYGRPRRRCGRPA